MKKTLLIKPPEKIYKLISEAIANRGDPTILAQYLYILAHHGRKVNVLQTGKETSVVQFDDGVKLEIWNQNLY